MKIGFIGAGKVGWTLGKYWSENLSSQDFELTGYYSRTPASAEGAAKFTHSRAFPDKESLIKASDGVFLTVPDGTIQEVWKEICKLDLKGKFVAHCSGALSTEETFPALKESGACAYSIHPLFAVSDKEETWKELKGVFFSIQQDPSNESPDPFIDNLEKMMKEAGNPYKKVPADKKTLYHLASAVASNLVCGIVDMSLDLLGGCGFSQEEGRKALAPILRGNMNHIADVGVKDALTGPMERNDIGTVKDHLSVFEDEEEKEIYRLLSKRLMRIAQEKHPDRDYSDMKKLLEK